MKNAIHDKTDWTEIRIPLFNIYEKNNILSAFSSDENYLKEALEGIEDLWDKQYNSINKINYVMFSEAPLWGNAKKYMYNPKTRLSQFFYKSDLEYALNKVIRDKDDFLRNLREIGFIIVDLSPFALNENYTSINYRKISKADYQKLVNESAISYLIPKLRKVHLKSSGEVQYLFRYTRIRNLFQNLLVNLFEKEKISSAVEIKEIAQKGGGIDREKLKKILIKNTVT